MFTKAEERILAEWNANVKSVIDGADPVFSYKDCWAQDDGFNPTKCFFQPEKINLSMGSITDVVCQYFNIERAILSGPRQNDTTVDARAAFYSLVKYFIPSASFVSIGKEMGFRDPACVKCGVRRATKMLSKDPMFKERYMACATLIRQFRKPAN